MTSGPHRSTTAPSTTEGSTTEGSTTKLPTVDYSSVEESVKAACRDAKRDPREVVLIAVSKMHPAAAVQAAYNQGARHFGENYAQELQEKGATLAGLDDLAWHFIGRFQSNKINTLKRFNPVWHTPSSADDLRAIGKRQADADVLLQVNIGDEPQKGGVSLADLDRVLDEACTVEGVRLRGLMTIPPVQAPAEKSFATMAELAWRHRSRLGRFSSPWLSMGMSEDFAQAIAYGATHVRIGTAIFGKRPAHQP